MITVHQAGRIAEFLTGLHVDVYREPESELHQRLSAKAVTLVTQHLKPGSLVLDVGCGRGYAEAEFLKAGYIVHATTLCKEELTAKRTFADQNGLPMGWTEYFDCVFARHVLEHSPIPDFTLSEFKRCLKPNGLLYLEMPAPDTACQHETNANHYSVFTWKAWIAKIKRQFQIIDGKGFELELKAGRDIYYSFLCRK